MAIEKIIVLEDDAIVRSNLENLLRRKHYDVAAVATIAAAQEYLNRDNFDLIFLDVRLPDGDGTDLLKAYPVAPAKAAGGHDDRLWLGRIRRGMHEKRRV